MPIYEYECRSCGAHFDVMQKLSDPIVTECGLCKGTDVRKLLGTPALQFKGSGWYVTDYAGKSPKPSDALRKGAAASESSTTSSGSDSAPANTCSSGCCGTPKAD